MWLWSLQGRGKEGDDRPCKKIVDQSWGISWKRDTRKGSRFNRSIACDLYLSFPRFEFLRVIYSGSLCIANFGSENLMERKMKGAFPFQRRIFIPSTSGIWFGQDGSDPWEVISICPEIFLNGCRDRGRAIFPSFSTGLWGSYGERHNIEMPVRDSNNGYIYRLEPYSCIRLVLPLFTHMLIPTGACSWTSACFVKRWSTFIPYYAYTCVTTAS